MNCNIKREFQKDSLPSHIFLIQFLWSMDLTVHRSLQNSSVTVSNPHTIERKRDEHKVNWRQNHSIFSYIINIQKAQIWKKVQVGGIQLNAEIVHSFHLYPMKQILNPTNCTAYPPGRFLLHDLYTFFKIHVEMACRMLLAMEVKYKAPPASNRP